MRRRSASGDMSTSSIASARRTTASGIVSRCLAPVMRSTTSLSDSRCWMFSVEITSIPAASSSSTSCQRFGLREPGRIRVRELVDEHLRGLAGEDGVDVHLLQRRAAVLDRPARDDLEPVDLLRGPRAPVRLDVADDDVAARARSRAALRSASRTSCRRRAPPRGRCATDPSPCASVCQLRLRELVEREVELQHVHTGLTEEPECARVGVVLHEHRAPDRRAGPVPWRRVPPGCGRWRPRCRGRGPTRTRSRHRPAPSRPRPGRCPSGRRRRVP